MINKKNAGISKIIGYDIAQMFISYLNNHGKNSKYQDKQVDAILNDMIAVLEKHQAPVDLSLVVLGNMVTNLLVSSVGTNQRIALANAFSEALLNSVNKQKS